MFVGSFTLVLPYFPTGTAERVSARPVDSVTDQYMTVISCIPLMLL